MLFFVFFGCFDCFIMSKQENSLYKIKKLKRMNNKETQLIEFFLRKVCPASPLFVLYSSILSNSSICESNCWKIKSHFSSNRVKSSIVQEMGQSLYFNWMAYIWTHFFKVKSRHYIKFKLILTFLNIKKIVIW